MLGNPHGGSYEGQVMGKRGVTLLVVAVAMLLILASGGVWWYTSVPHTAEAQFAVAEKLEKGLRAEAVTKTVGELTQKIEETIEQYRRVGGRFGKSPKAAEALEADCEDLRGGRQG